MGFPFFAMNDEPPFTDSELEQQERDLKEFEEICHPLVEYLQKKYHPHARIIIEWNRATLTEDKCGVPFQVPD